MKVELKWVTPDAEKMIAEMARVSADPKKKSRPDYVLIGYLLRNKHWSPFEMANICYEIHTTRDIGRQILRHWTMRPQEASQRYQDVSVFGDPTFRECRLQHPTNRQASIQTDDAELKKWWTEAQHEVWENASTKYHEALNKGIAKEVARAVVPEGLAPTKMYMNAPVRSALHFCDLRMGHGSQKEVTEVAKEMYNILNDEMPNICLAFNEFMENEREAKRIAEWGKQHPLRYRALLEEVENG
jgi:thymidylate synthase (FAD)